MYTSPPQHLWSLQMAFPRSTLMFQSHASTPILSKPTPFLNWTHIVEVAVNVSIQASRPCVILVQAYVTLHMQGQAACMKEIIQARSCRWNATTKPFAGCTKANVHKRTYHECLCKIVSHSTPALHDIDSGRITLVWSRKALGEALVHLSCRDAS